ncbi:UDP-2,4-diacetamido-2,4,6-trideoxy-beta-L-altropyranose hydrolase [Candidatus Micrarchaeota archaeon]|nr:UDP-2,4-diacetamido-2,4,6-trideoxy-beta-L-altropyranose hydrolase [Candidatus Micrarchaeota archaeon]
MNFAFRTNANYAVGSGHLRRCLTLASALKETAPDASIFFFTSGSGDYQKLISDGGFSVVDLGSSLSIEEDLEETIATVSKNNIDILIVDNYSINVNYLRNLKPRVKLLVVFDDHMHIKQYPCHVLVNLNLYGHLLDYSCDKNTRLLLGTEFVQLRPEFDPYQEFKRENPDKVKHILVTFGGSDVKGVTIFVVKALSKLKQDFLAYIVTGTNFKRGEDLAKLVGLDSRFIVLPEVGDMAKKIEKTDLAIASPSSIFYELALLKTPCILIGYADNQKLILDYAGKNGLAVSVGEIGSISEGEFSSTIKRLIENKEERDNLSRRLEDLVDGLGRYRLAEALLESYNNQNNPANSQSDEEKGDHLSDPEDAAQEAQ